MYIFDLFRGKKVLIDERNACRSQYQYLQKEFKAASVNWAAEKAELEDDIAVISDEARVLLNIINEYKNSDVGQLVYPYPMPAPIVKDYTWVWNVGHNHGFMEGSFGFLPQDGNFNIAPEEETIKFIQWDLTDKAIYQPDNSDGKPIKDCDKFGVHLWDRYRWLTRYNNMGYVLDLSGGHGYNAFINEKGQLKIVEPQSDKVWLFVEAKAKGIYDAERGYFVI